MKRTLLALIVIAGLTAYSCATEGYNTQKGAAIGAVGGALIGQAIGRNTAGTLIGAASGALVGAVAGNVVDQDQANRRLEQLESSRSPVAAAPAPQEAPPGEWVEVPGSWVDGKWVPSHRAWVPVNPGGPVAEANPGAQGPPLPAYAMQAPPMVVPIPGSYVYFVPDAGVDILFYQGYWYRPHGGRWFRAGSYNGPWAYVGPRRVPRAIVGLPPDYRRGPYAFAPVPHGDLQRNWARWERERHWDRR
jgi:hypothetical protein